MENRKEIRKLLNKGHHEGKLEFINIDLEKEKNFYMAFIYNNDNVYCDEYKMYSSTKKLNEIKKELSNFMNYFVFSHTFSPVNECINRYDEDRNTYLSNMLVGIRYTDMDNMALLLSKVYKAFSSRGIRVNINGTPINKLEDICTCLFSVRDEYNNSKQYKK